jgi:hypothetical protein
MLPESLLGCLSAFEDCFTAPSYRRFLTLMQGWLVCIGKHTVTGVMRAAGVAQQDVSGYHRFFNRGAWDPQQVERVVLRLALRLVPPDVPVAMTLDDTLARHTGKHIASAGMHRDPLLSTGARPFFHFGHRWVVLAVVVTMPWGKRLSLPVLARLYRTERAAKAADRPHVKLTELALQMLVEVGKHYGERRFVVYADNAYVNRTIVQGRPKHIDVVGRGRMDAALYALPPKRTKSTMGRPRIRGNKLHCPQQRADSPRGWAHLSVDIYGRAAEVQVKVFDAIWYKVSHDRLMRIVVVRGWPGHDKDDVLVSTDLSLGAEAIIEGYCQRWSLEETFGWVKSRLGFEDPHNRVEHAVHRTAPMALWCSSLTVIWYAQWSQRRKTLPMRADRWQRDKTAPSFADMLATLRRQCWAVWVSDRADGGRLDQKSLAPLLEMVGYG